jgi:uncharacterized membrane protein YozB (DUF420 family)
MSPQAILVFSVLFILTTLSTIIMIKGNVETHRIVISTLAWLAFALLVAFDTNCLTYGQCDIYSWIRTTLYIIIPIIAIIIMSVVLLSTDKKDDVEQQTSGTPSQSSNTQSS